MMLQAVPTPHPSSSPIRPNELRWLVVVLGAVLLFCLPLFTYPLGRDQADFAVLADTILHGGAPFRDAWNPKPPLTFFLLAAVLAIARQMVMVAILNVAIILATSTMIYLLGRQMFGHAAALVAAFGCGLALGLYDFWYQSQPDGWTNLVLAAATYCFIRSRHQGLAWLVGCGAGVGLAFGFKYTGALLGVLFLLLLLFLPATPRRPLWRELLALAAGFVLAVLPWLLFLAAHGAIGDLLESITATGGYTSLSLKSPTFVGRIPIAFGKFIVLHLSLAALTIIASLAAIIAALRHRFFAASVPPSPAIPTSPPSEVAAISKPYAVLILGGWLILGFIGVVVQGKLYAYHWQVLIAPLSLAAGYGFVALCRFVGALAGRYRHLAQASVATLLVLIMLVDALIQQAVYPDFLAYVSGQQSASQYEQRFTSGDFTYSASLQAASYLAAHTTPNQTAYIWGFESLVYWLADRRPASRFNFNFPLVGWWYPKQWQDETIASLRQAPPTYIVVMHNDAMPQVNNFLTDSAAQLSEFPALADFISTRYQHETDIQDFSFYHLK